MTVKELKNLLDGVDEDLEVGFLVDDKKETYYSHYTVHDPLVVSLTFPFDKPQGKVSVQTNALPKTHLILSWT